jgi:hypothetical protein
MATVLDDAIEVLRSLPENVQAAAAHAILEYASIYEDQHANA